MRTRLTAAALATAALAAIAGGAAALATGGGDDGEQASGPDARRARAAALAHAGGGSVEEVEREDEEGAAWEVELRRPDGSLVEVLLDERFRVVGSGADDEEEARAGAADTAEEALDPARFSPVVDHPLVPLASLRLTVHEGRERDPDTGATVTLRVETRAGGATERVAGVRAAAVEVREYEDGALVERTRDLYAQRDDGSVWYLGERVDDLEGGRVVGHRGQWLAGRNGARAGLFMPARPRVGDAFEQERAPGVAEDRSTVLAVGVRARTPAGSFSGCVRTRDHSPLDGAVETKVYCPGAGIVSEQGPGVRLELVRLVRAR